MQTILVAKEWKHLYTIVNINIQMEVIISTLKPFLEHPNRSFHIRELARILNTNHMTVRKRLLQLVKEGYLICTKSALTSNFQANISSKKYVNIRTYHHLEEIRKSNLIEHISDEFEPLAIILFGSYAKATDDDKSDIDLFVLSVNKKELDLGTFEKKLGKKISLHIFTKGEWEKTKQKNPHLVNSICNGMTLAGFIEVV